VFALLSFPFIQNAFLAGSLVAIVAAFMGYFLIIRGLTFAGHALANIGFAGAAGAVLVGIPPVYGLFAFTLASSLVISLLGKEIRQRDIAVGVIMTMALGLGVLFLALYPGFAEGAYSILFGTILGVSRSDVLVTGLFALVIVAGMAVIGRPLLFSSFDPELAEARAVPVKLLGALFLALTALTVSIAVQVVGVLLIFALLIGPPATAIRLVKQPALAIGLAILLGLVYVWVGILLAINTNWPVSFFISAVSFCVYLPVRLSSARFKSGVRQNA